MNDPAMDQPWSCEVRARGQVIRYRSAGAGRPLLLLHSGAPPEPAGTELLSALERRYRVIVPEPPAPDVDVTSWLDAFLEGLGGSGLRVLAAGRFRVPALGLALAEPELIARLALLLDGERGEIALGHAVENAEELARVPLLLVPPDLRGAALAEQVIGFLGTNGDVPAPPTVPTGRPA